MSKRKRYSELSKRQVFRRLEIQSKADLNLHDSSSEFENDLQVSDDTCYITQGQSEKKNYPRSRIDNEVEGIPDFIENMVDIQNIQLVHEDPITQDILSNGTCYETDSEEEDDDSQFLENDVFNFVKELRSFAIDCQIKHIHLNRLLQLLTKAGMKNLPTDVRTLLKTPRTSNAEISCCAPGEYLHYGLKKAIQDQLYGLTYINKCDISNYSCPSSYLNIYKVDNLSPLQLWPAQCISHKGFLITHEDVTYTMPLLQE